MACFLDAYRYEAHGCSKDAIAEAIDSVADVAECYGAAMGITWPA